MSRFAILALVVGASLLISGSGLEAFAAEQKAFAKITSITKIGTEKHLVKYKVCAIDKTLQTQTILVKSTNDQVKQVSKKPLPANTCNTYETKIKAKYPSTIQVKLL